MTAVDPWLDEAQLTAWLSMAVLMEVFPTSVDAQLRDDLGVNRFEYSILAMLSEEPDGTLVMSDLAAVAFGSLSRLSHAVGRLETRGWLERKPGVGGRRHTTVTLTTAGRAAIEAAAPLHAAHLQRALVEPLTERELADLGRIARKLVAANDPEMAAQLDDLIPTVIARNLGTAQDSA